MPTKSQGPGTTLASLPGLGPIRLRALAEMEIHALEDLLWHLPRRYEDLRPWDGESLGWAVVRGRVRQARQVGQRLETELEGREGPVRGTFFHKPYLAARLLRQGEVAWWGEVRRIGAAYAMTEPELIDPERLEWGLRPIYAARSGLTQTVLRLAAKAALARTASPHVRWFQMAHCPGTLADAEQGRLQLARIEATTVATAVRAALPPVAGWPLSAPGPDPTPYPLRPDQVRALSEIRADLRRPQAMRRILLGEVGSGKTAVAMLAARGALAAGLNVVMLVPTELLVAQHLAAARVFCGDLGPVLGLTAGRKLELATAPALVVATSAAFAQDLRLRPVGLLIVDEEQRFGVRQRQSLLTGHPSPHLLTLTATPIPRTLAQMVSQQLGVSVLGNPYGRLPAVRVVGRAERSYLYQQAAARVRAGGQVLIVCPRRIQEAVSGGLAADALARKLRQRWPGLPVHLITGAVPMAAVSAMLADLSQGAPALVVGTSVLEVGLDLPAATLVIVEGAGAFGLAQLHQMRGRVGRRGQAAEAVWVDSSGDEDVSSRLRRAAGASTGEQVAALDLELRGCGLLEGVLQHGFPPFRALRLPSEMGLLASAFSAVQAAGN